MPQGRFLRHISLSNAHMAMHVRVPIQLSEHAQTHRQLSPQKRQRSELSHVTLSKWPSPRPF